MAPIVLLTDFGARDWYVASMKGMILSIVPEARIIDISHEIGLGDRRAAAFILSQSYQEFPQGTIFLVVIDPGVGGSRSGIVLYAGGQFFVGPDNGVFSFHDLLEVEVAMEARVIENRNFMSPVISNTFHGRDIFAPVAAHLLRVQDFGEIGRELGSIVKMRWPRAKYGRGKAEGEVIYIDRFGNAISNIRATHLGDLKGLQSEVSIMDRSFPLAGTFSEVEPRNPLAYVGSGGFLEIALNGGNAAQNFGLTLGQEVKFKLV